MSPIEFLTPAGPTATPAPSGERPDADVFAGLLDGQTPTTAPRGRLGVGRWLQEQSGQIRYRDDGAGAVVGLPGLVTGPTDRPVIDPGTAGETKTGGPLINPGPGVTTKTDQPLINPGPGQTKTEGPLVLPGVADGKVQGPLVLPGEPGAEAAPASAVATALQALAGDEQSQSVTALVQAAQQAVSRAPETTAIAAATEVAPDAEAPELALDPGLVDAEPVQAGSAAPQGAATTGSTTSATAMGATPPDATTQANSASADTSDLASLDSSATDPLNSEPDVQAVPVRAELSAPVLAARTDAATVAGRMSFDALAQVSAQIIRRLETRTTRFDMELNPVELGRVDVRLDIDSEGRLAARLAFDNPAAALDLRGRVEDLRRELQQAGFQLADDAFSFTDRGGSGSGRGSDAEDARRAHARSAEAADQIDAAAQPALRTMTRLGLDVRV